MSPTTSTQQPSSKATFSRFAPAAGKKKKEVKRVSEEDPTRPTKKEGNNKQV